MASGLIAPPLTCASVGASSRDGRTWNEEERGKEEGKARTRTRLDEVMGRSSGFGNEDVEATRRQGQGGGRNKGWPRRRLGQSSIFGDRTGAGRLLLLFKSIMLV